MNEPGTTQYAPPPAVVAAPPARQRHHAGLRQPLLAAADDPMGAQPQHVYYPILPNNPNYVVPSAPAPAPQVAVMSGGPSRMQSQVPQNWSCLACTFENPSLNTRCRVCSTPRGHSGPSHAAQVPPPPPLQAVQRARQVSAPPAQPQAPPVAHAQQVVYRSVPAAAPVQPVYVVAPSAPEAPVPLQRSNEEVKPFRDWFWCSCITMVCCAVPAFPCALIALLNAVRARSAAFYGDTTAALRYSKKAKKLIIGGIAPAMVARAGFFVMWHHHAHAEHGFHGDGNGMDAVGEHGGHDDHGHGWGGWHWGWPAPPPPPPEGEEPMPPANGRNGQHGPGGRGEQGPGQPGRRGEQGAGQPDGRGEQGPGQPGGRGEHGPGQHGEHGHGQRGEHGEHGHRQRGEHGERGHGQRGEHGARNGRGENGEHHESGRQHGEHGEHGDVNPEPPINGDGDNKPEPGQPIPPRDRNNASVTCSKNATKSPQNRSQLKT